MWLQVVVPQCLIQSFLSKFPQHRHSRFTRVLLEVDLVNIKRQTPYILHVLAEKTKNIIDGYPIFSIAPLPFLILDPSLSYALETVAPVIS